MQKIEKIGFLGELEARCCLAMYRVLSVINHEHSMACLEEAHEKVYALGHESAKDSVSPGQIISTEPMLLNWWQKGRDDATRDFAIEDALSRL